MTGNNKRDLLKGARVNFGGFIIRLGARLPFLLVVGHLFGAEIFGQYVFAVIFLETVCAFSVFGFRRSLFHFLSEHIHQGERATHIVFNALFTTIIAAVLLVSGIFLLQEQLTLYFGPVMIEGALMVLPGVVLGAMTEIFLTATRTFRVMRYEMVTKSIVEPYSVLVMSLVFYLAGFQEQGLLLGYSVMLACSFLSALYGFGKMFSLRAFLKSRPDGALLADMIRFSAPTALYDLLTMLLLRVDVFILSAFAPQATVGIYGIALQVSTTVKKIGQSFEPILAPVIAQSLKDQDMKKTAAEIAQVSNWIISIQALILVFLVFYGQGVMGLFGEEFYVGALILIFLILGDSINGSIGLSELLILYCKPLYNPLLTLVMLVFHVFVCFKLVREYGGEGVAFSMALTYLIMNMARLFIVRVEFGVFALNHHILKPVLAAGITGGLLILLGKYVVLLSMAGVVAGVFVSLLSYCTILFWLASSGEREKIKNFYKAKRGASSS